MAAPMLLVSVMPMSTTSPISAWVTRGPFFPSGRERVSAPEAVAVLERFFPKILKNPALQMTAAMTLRQVAGFAQSGLTADSLAEIDAQLRALPSSDG